MGWLQALVQLVHCLFMDFSEMLIVSHSNQPLPQKDTHIAVFGVHLFVSLLFYMCYENCTSIVLLSLLSFAFEYYRLYKVLGHSIHHQLIGNTSNVIMLLSEIYVILYMDILRILNSTRSSRSINQSIDVIPQVLNIFPSGFLE